MRVDAVSASVFDRAKEMSDVALAVLLEHYQAQQKTSSQWVSVIRREQKRRQKLKKQEYNHAGQ